MKLWDINPKDLFPAVIIVVSLIEILKIYSPVEVIFVLCLNIMSLVRVLLLLVLRWSSRMVLLWWMELVLVARWTVVRWWWKVKQMVRLALRDWLGLRIQMSG